MPTIQIESLFGEILARRIFIKAIFSKPEDKRIIKSVAEPYQKPDRTPMLRIETFTGDNKAYHKNLPYESADELKKLAFGEYRQVNIFTSAGNLELRRSKSGATHVSGRLDDGAGTAGIPAKSGEIPAHNSGKNYIIDPSRDAGFLAELGLCDKTGRIHDKKQPKFRQINRFLEIIRDVEDALPSDRPAVIYDLCCGKSYLTFAVYYYLTSLCGRDVRIYGVDLKRDVVDYCNAAAKRQGFEKLTFINANINEYEPSEAPDMVISLHACDTATDIVLYNSIRWGAKIILSTPCCHHEMSAQLSEPSPDATLRDHLSFILRSPILKQKFCDAATDALRVKRLESCGYKVATLELIDPEDTPKNLMIRAVLDRNHAAARRSAALSEYRESCKSLGVSPYLDKLLDNYEK